MKSGFLTKTIILEIPLSATHLHWTHSLKVASSEDLPASAPYFFTFHKIECTMGSKEVRNSRKGTTPLLLKHSHQQRTLCYWVFRTLGQEVTRRPVHAKNGPLFPHWSGASLPSYDDFPSPLWDFFRPNLSFLKIVRAPPPATLYPAMGWQVRCYAIPVRRSRYTRS